MWDKEELMKHFIPHNFIVMENKTEVTRLGFTALLRYFSKRLDSQDKSMTSQK